MGGTSVTRCHVRACVWAADVTCGRAKQRLYECVERDESFSMSKVTRAKFFMRQEQSDGSGERR